MGAPKVSFGRMEMVSSREGEMPIYVDDEQIGAIDKQTAWDGSRYVVSQYGVTLEIADGEYDKEFPVKGLYAGQYGAWSQRGYETSRKALTAAKKYARLAAQAAVEREDFLDFLESTLIPDLHESGADATAEDFEKCVQLIRDGESDPQFVDFLTSTLIPDLYESGSEATAEDFERCVRYMEERT